MPVNKPPDNKPSGRPPNRLRLVLLLSLLAVYAVATLVYFRLLDG